MKIRLGELKLDDAINLLHQNGLKLVIYKFYVSTVGAFTYLTIQTKEYFGLIL